MPVQSCTKKGIKGKKYGKKGKCYTGKSAHRKAAAQGKAMKSKGYSK